VLTLRKQELTINVCGMVLQAVNVDWPTIFAGSQLVADARAHADSLIRRAQAANLPALTMSSCYAMPFRTQVSCFAIVYYLTVITPLSDVHYGSCY
jgi:hypothetical protein